MFSREKRRKPLAQGAAALALPITIPYRISKTSLALFRRGDSDVFSALYERFKRPISRYVGEKISDAEIADDIVQEVFLKAFRFRESYREEYAFSTWLWSIARNSVTDHLRALRNCAIGAAFSANEPVNPEELACSRQNAEAIAIGKDERKRLLRMIRPLTRLQKRVIWLRAVHQLPFGEIASKLGLSLAAVKNLAYRAKINLTQDLTPAFEGAF